MYKRFGLVSVFILFFASFCSAASKDTAADQNRESDQQISEFSLAGYGEKGKKTWDIAGKSADIFDNVVKLNDVTANMYNEKDEIKLTAKKGDFDKTEGKVHVEQDVVITTSSGSKLTTDSLDWDRKNQVVATNDVVNITRDNMVTVAKGAMGHPDLNKFKLEKDVKVDINPKEATGKEAAAKNKITIICDGPLEIDYAKNIATFKNNVKVDTQDNTMYSDTMDVYFLTSDKTKPKQDKPAAVDAGVNSAMMGTSIDKIVARGNVKIIQGENTTYSQEAQYTAADKRIVLTGRPQLVIYSTEGLSASLGN